MNQRRLVNMLLCHANSTRLVSLYIVLITFMNEAHRWLVVKLLIKRASKCVYCWNCKVWKWVYCEMEKPTTVFILMYTHVTLINIINLNMLFITFMQLLVIKFYHNSPSKLTFLIIPIMNCFFHALWYHFIE